MSRVTRLVLSYGTIFFYPLGTLTYPYKSISSCAAILSGNLLPGDMQQLSNRLHHNDNVFAMQVAPTLSADHATDTGRHQQSLRIGTPTLKILQLCYQLPFFNSVELIAIDLFVGYIGSQLDT